MMSCWFIVFPKDKGADDHKRHYQEKSKEKPRLERKSCHLCLILLQDLLLERSSNTLKSIAELDVKEMQRHRQNTQLWQVMLLVK
jgi:hypothetical protein